MTLINHFLIVFAPLFGAVMAGFFGKSLGDRRSQIVTCLPMVLAAILSFTGLLQILGQDNSTLLYKINIMSWVTSGALDFSWTLRFDTLTYVMALVVNGVSCLVHIYSVGYMSEDKSIPRFMSYLSLFTFFMLMLVTSDNLVQLFFGWEGVGLASYLLIGFWFEKPEANKAAMKAFLVNRVGDFGFALGIFAIFYLFNTVEFDIIFSQASLFSNAHMVFLGYDVHALTVVCLLLFMGAMGKSAQLGLHTWLPDAMEGPTPVSALIHAATMVTAGVFMVARLSPLFEYAPIALQFICFVGAATAFFAATVAVTQNDIKRVIAYSTCSQLGYMFFALGVSAYGAAVFHLFTHAFFKALLFLGAGSVIHAMSHEQDMRKMGGVWKKIPFTYSMMWIGNLALAGVPLFAGYYSKDAILESAFADHSLVGMFAFVLGIAAAFLTAFYSWRLLFMTFHGKPRASQEVMNHIHESPKVMTVPLLILGVGAVFAGMLFYPYFIGNEYADFWGNAIFVLPENNVLLDIHHVPLWVKKAPLIVGVLGVSLAYLFYIRYTFVPNYLAERFSALYQFSLKKWYFDEVYDALFVRTSLFLAQFFWKKGDINLIDKCGPNGVAAVTQELSERAREAQSGYIYHYAFVMLTAVIVCVSWFFFSRI